MRTPELPTETEMRHVILRALSTVAAAVMIFKKATSLIVTFAIAAWIVYASPWFRDDSDAQGWFAPRSFMSLHTDNLTGCQYLKAGGTLLPRRDGDGKHLGCYTK